MINFVARVPKLDNWVQYGNTLIGRSYNHPNFENGQRVQTNHVALLDRKSGFVKCSENEMWQLGAPGKLSMYEDPVTKRFY